MNQKKKYSKNNGKMKKRVDITGYKCYIGFINKENILLKQKRCFLQWNYCLVNERRNRNMKKKLVLGMAGVMAFTTLLGTNVVIGNADEDKVEITYTSRGNADEIKVYQQAVDAFNEAQDKIHVTFEASPSDGYSQQLITQLAGGTAADVIFVEDTVMSQLVKNGTIAKI